MSMLLEWHGRPRLANIKIWMPISRPIWDTVIIKKLSLSTLLPLLLPINQSDYPSLNSRKIMGKWMEIMLLELVGNDESSPMLEASTLQVSTYYISKITACISTLFTYCAKEVIRSNEKVNCFQMEDTTLLSIASSNRWSMSIKTTFISLVSQESKHAMDHACLGKIFTQGWRGRPLGIS